jgi:hypothetical protein
VPSHDWRDRAENTTQQTLCDVRVEVHLSSGTELGPTERTDLAPGEATVPGVLIARTYLQKRIEKGVDTRFDLKLADHTQALQLATEQARFDYQKRPTSC